MTIASISLHDRQAEMRERVESRKLATKRRLVMELEEAETRQIDRMLELSEYIPSSFNPLTLQGCSLNDRSFEKFKAWSQ